MPVARRAERGYQEERRCVVNKGVKYVSIELSGEQWGRLSKALQHAFPNYAALQSFVTEQLGQNLATIAAEGPLTKVTYDLIQWAQAKGWGGTMVQAAQLVQPDNPKIQAIAAELLGQRILVQYPDAPPKALVGEGLERVIRTSLHFQDAEKWWADMGQILPKVCQVRVDLGSTEERGTGFLVAKDVVLTNYHVVEGVINDKNGGAKIECVFDYKRDGKSNVLNPGKSHELAPNWLVDASEYSPKAGAPEGDEPSPEQLDYALLRLSTNVADEALGNSNVPGAHVRGYISIAQPEPTPDKDAPLYIVQHPKGEQLQIALDTQAILWKSRNRVRYRTNTECGSSGSPCFDEKWNPVALHHYGDPGCNPDFNQGIPLTAIVALLKKRGKLGELG